MNRFQVVFKAGGCPIVVFERFATNWTLDFWSAYPVKVLPHKRAS